MALQMRRGQYKELDPDKLLPGEWAVSLDEKYVHMCFAPGVVMRMATYEAFERDMREIQTILATCQDIQAAVSAMVALAEQHKNNASEYALLAESWAHGNTGGRTDENENNSKYHSQQAQKEADRAKREADRAHTIVGFTGSYNDLSDKPVIPTKTSQLANDSGFKTTDNDTWKANTSSNEGYVAKGIGQVNKVWGTDANGNPGWRNQVSLTNNLLANQTGTALDAAQAPVIVGKINAVDNKVAAINNTLRDLTGYVNTTVMENDYINADYLRNGKTVEVHFARNKVELKANTEYTIGFLQEGCRPPRSIGTMIAVNRQCVMGYLSISSQTGEVKVMFYSDLPVSSYTYYNFIFSCR